MPFLIGQCCSEQVISNPSSGSGDASGKNEIIPFDALAEGTNTIVIPWNSTRKARFGNAAVIYVELDGGGDYLPTLADCRPDSLINTTKYTLRIGGPISGRIIIT